MRSVSPAVALVAALGSAPALAAPPTAPSDLRVDVYSGTAAELFWSRSIDPDGLVRGYEIRRDGQLVDTRDGLSYFTDDLTDGRAFAFTVTALDFDGERSAPVSVSVVGGDRDGAVGSGGGRPPPPANLTSRVYSSSAAELFWDRSDQRGLSYEIRRNGRTVATTDGTSAFLSGLPRTDGEAIDVVAIDANGQRSGAATVTLGGPAGGGDRMEPVEPPSGGDAPAAPSGLRAELYSSSAGEVFWDRVSGTPLSYEVILDGEVAATTTGTSYFAGNRPGLDGTRVEVVAIGPDGARSAASSTTLGSGGASSPDPDPNPGAEVPPAPANARIEVYSSTAAELFFDRAPASANVVETEIVRDGETIGTTRGTSFFDDTRRPDREHAYELTAIDASGNRSAPTSVGEASAGDPTDGPIEPSPPGDAEDSPFLPAALAAPLLASIESGSPLSVANHETFVRAFYDVAEPRVLNTLLGEVRRVQAELRDAAGGADSRFVAESVASIDAAADKIVFACPDGGTVRAVFDGAGTAAPETLMDFRRCVLSGGTLSGITHEAVTRPNGGDRTDRTFGGYRIETRSYPFTDEVVGLGAEGERFTIETEAGPSTSVFGRVVEISFVLDEGIVLDSRQWRGNWQLDDADATLSVTDLYADNTRRSEGGDDGDRSKPYFVASGTITNGREITAVNQSDFRELRRLGRGVVGDEVFRDAQGGIMNLIAGTDDDTGEQRTRVRIDTDGVILNRALPAGLEATRYLSGR